MYWLYLPMGERGAASSRTNETEQFWRSGALDRALIFAVDLRATKPAGHPSGGVFRTDYIHGSDEMAMIYLRLIATVTGTEWLCSR